MKLKALLSVAALAVVCAPASALAQSAAAAPAPPAEAAVAPVTPAHAAPAPAAPTAHAAPSLPALVAAAPAAVAVPAAPAAAPAAVAAPHEPGWTLPAPAVAPQTPTPPAGATSFFIEGNFLGVRTEEVTRENASRYGVSGEPRGVGVREVIKGSPAEKAGLREGDVILRFDGEQVTSARKLTRLIEESAPAHSVRLTILRGGSEQQLSATLARREPFGFKEFGPLTVFGPGDMPHFGGELLGNPELWEHKGEEFRQRLEEMQRKHPGVFTLGSSRRIGVSTSTLGKQLADYFGVPHGVLVSSVEANSPADKAGLKAGDVVTEVDGKRVEDVDDLVRGLGAKNEGEVTLTVVRDRKQRTVRVTPERRRSPGFNLRPGSFRVVRPATTMTLPRTLVTPWTFATPRVMATPRIRVIAPGDRIL
ncbi:MAG TPA: PDZ domain-containing protein [Pyrinomonadaceae bacterium]